MPYLQLELPCRRDAQPRIERALEDAGALSVALQDAHLDAADEQAIFEPGVGETPLWDELQMQALFDGDADALALLAALEAAEPQVDAQLGVTPMEGRQCGRQQPHADGHRCRHLQHARGLRSHRGRRLHDLLRGPQQLQRAGTLDRDRRVVAHEFVRQPLAFREPRERD